MDKQDGCSDFEMNKNDTMWIKVQTGGPAIQMHQVKVMLEDGQEYSAYFRPSQDETFPLKIQAKDPEHARVDVLFLTIFNWKQKRIKISRFRNDLHLFIFSAV